MRIPLLISLLCILAILAIACDTPGTEVSGGDGVGRWSYANGPNGEHCLFYNAGSLNSQMVAMHCDSVNWDE